MTTCAQCNGKCNASPLEHYMTNVQGVVCGKDYVLIEHLIVEKCKQEVNARACTYDCAKVI